MTEAPVPQPFLEFIVELIEMPPAIVGCAGYEAGTWRRRELIQHSIGWLTEFGLRYSEWSSLEHHDAVRKLAKAVRMIHQAEQSDQRGELGELLLHIVLRQYFQTFPAISKIYFKDGPNETVKGFDSFHVTKNDNDEFELWLGEAKLWTDPKAAIRDIAREIDAHLELSYLKNEFTAICNKLDDAWPETETLQQLLDTHTSLDKVFPQIRIPILVAYTSETVQNFSAHVPEYIEEITQEAETLRAYFMTKCSGLASTFHVHLCFIPLEGKNELVEEWDNMLVTLQDQLG